MSEWRTISIRLELIREIEEMLKTSRYRSISEFVSEAVRLRLEGLVHAGAMPAGKHQEVPSMEDCVIKDSPKLKTAESGIQCTALKTVHETPLQIQPKEMEQKEPKKAEQEQ